MGIIQIVALILAQRGIYINYLITGYQTSSAQTPTVKLSPLEAVSFYFSSAQRAEQVRH